VADAGQYRLVYANTVSVLEAAMISRAMGGDDVKATLVLLTAEEVTVRARLARRETGSQLAASIERSLRAARDLDEQALAGTVRILHRRTVGSGHRSGCAPGSRLVDAFPDHTDSRIPQDCGP
jgi:hypothetical protein